MRPTFYGLELSKSALFMAQKQMDLTGHNIANVNTAGYTRQRIVQQAIDPYNVMTRLKAMDNGKVGAGVLTHSLDQIRDVYLDRRIRNHNSILGYWSQRYDGMYEVESLFNDEVGAANTSLIKLTSDFFTAVDALSDNKASGDREIRTNLMVSAKQLTSAITDIYTKLEELQYEHELIISEPNAGLVARVNELMSSICDYNKQIYAFEVNNYRGDGLPHERALDLRDQRNLLLDELSTLVNIDYYEDSETKLHVSIAEIELLNHDKYEQVYCKKMINNPLNGREQELSAVCWYPDKSDPNGYIQLNLTGGKIKAHLDLRDGQAVSPLLSRNSITGIPQIVEELNRFVQALAKEFNVIHQEAWSYPHDENGNLSQQGFYFFAPPTDGDGNILYGANGDVDYSKLTIRNFMIDAVIDPDQTYVDSNGVRKAGSVYNISISSKWLDPAQKPQINQANNEKGLELKELLYRDIDGVGALNKFVNTFLTTIASETKVAKDRTEEYTSIAYEMEQMFASYSGVSEDEEMTNLIRFNHAFTAASRVITSMDEQLDQIINRMGRVGL